MKLSDQIKTDFDETYLKVKKRGIELPFSADHILNSLINAGVKSLDALDIIYALKPELVVGISTNKILKRLNELIQEFGYDEYVLLKTESMKTIFLEYDEKRHVLGYKILKAIIREKLADFRYSSRVFRDLVDEFQRNLLALETEKIIEEDIDRILPISIRNIVGINPFSSDKCVNDYQRVIKLKLAIEKTWDALPADERSFVLQKFIESAYRVILLSFNYIPSLSLNATIIQMNSLVSKLSSAGNTTLSDQEVKMILSSIKRSSTVRSMEIKEVGEHSTILEEVTIISRVCDGLMSSGSIMWIVGRDKFGRDLFSFSSVRHIQMDGRSPELISSAIYGIETQLSEITRSTAQQFDQGENVILINSRKLFSLVTLIQKPVSHIVRQRLTELCEFIEYNLTNEISNFRGNVTPFQREIGQYLRKKFSTIFVGAWEDWY